MKSTMVSAGSGHTTPMVSTSMVFSTVESKSAVAFVAPSRKTTRTVGCCAGAMPCESQKAWTSPLVRMPVSGAMFPNRPPPRLTTAMVKGWSPVAIGEVLRL